MAKTVMMKCGNKVWINKQRQSYIIKYNNIKQFGFYLCRRTQVLKHFTLHAQQSAKMLFFICGQYSIQHTSVITKFSLTLY